ncbi:autotransporter domain-containing protein [Dyella tabacisoli]|uniref:Autotransporter domain-containing protein n=2 Tax=Dyella tabacisoli TaxID=2282381 RepID=A0A369UPP9_9GAMM|nr:autotransporter domain-containing protein [Dyella tabacisoli]
MVGLGFLSGYDYSDAQWVSSDGSVVIGRYSNSLDKSYVYRWTQATGMVSLGSSITNVAAASADGSVIVGTMPANGANSQAFRWTQSGGVVALGVPAGFLSSRPVGISADGTVVVGQSVSLSAEQAFRWSAVTGMQSVAAWLANASVSVPSNVTLTSANAANRDGTVLVGDSAVVNSNGEGWLARVGPVGSGLLTDIGAFNAGLVEANSQAIRGVTDLSNLAVFGVHHRSLLDSGQVRAQNGACAWAAVDAAHYDESNTRAELAEVGACKDFGSTRIGLGFGKAQARQDWSLGGKGQYDGHYLVAEVASQLSGAIEGSLLGYRGDFNVDTRRNYMNGANVDSSRAHTDATATAVRARLDWNNAAQWGQVSFSPYAVYNWTKTKLDAYTETGGGFPALFNGSSWITSEARVGAAGKLALSSSTGLRVALEAVHRFKGETNEIKGQVIDLFGFSVPGQKLKRNWARALVDIDYRVTYASVITLGANGASSGGDASWGVSAQYRMSF